MRWVVTCDADASAGREMLGGKAAALRDLGRAGLPVPEWFVVTPAAAAEGVTPALRREIKTAVAQLCPDGGAVAVRSSAVDEDGAGHSFAGQFESFLFVRPDDVAEKVAAVWASGSSERVRAYRRQHGLDAMPVAPAVLVQRMVDADVSGVAFAADPATGRRGVAVVAAVYGLGTSLVGGDADADTFHVERGGGIIHRQIATKRIAHRRDPDAAAGVSPHEIPEPRANQPALTDEQVQAVAALARQASRHFGRPQDIEWAIQDGRLFLLQSRPITTLAGLGDPEGVLTLWDNSNIVESYGGVTTPLTFSFARRAYEEVYRQFCRLMRVPPAVIERNDDVFRRMIGLVRGRVYYSLLSWYRLLAMLPGFKVNRRFMEQMMGVKEPLPDELLAQVIAAPASPGERVRDVARFLGSVASLAANHVLIRRRIAAFYERLKDALADPTPPLEEMRPDELAAYYRSLERQLIRRWDAPLVNDFLAMIFYGLLRGLATKWCGDADGTLQNDLISGGGGMVSAEPARLVKEMAVAAAGEPGLADVLADGTRDEAVAEAQRRPAFTALYRAYVDRFGDRCLEELKLESPTLHDDPMLLLRAVGRLARSNGKVTRTRPAAEGESPRRKAEARVRQSLRGRPLRRLLFGYVLRHARGRVRDRENLRFERTRVFGRVRRVFVELGRRFAAEGKLATPGDVFYLELEEVLGFVEGTTTSTRLSELAALRRSEFEAYNELPTPAERFETRGAVHVGNTFQGKPRTAPATLPDDDHDQRKGIGCCPGVVRGRVKVVTDPRNVDLPQGSILVARSTDPGWIMLFPAASGLLVERGSLLSHSAIVARELGLPAVVSVPDVTTWLSDGDEVELDGSTGVVRRLPAVERSADSRVPQEASHAP